MAVAIAFLSGTLTAAAQDAKPGIAGTAAPESAPSNPSAIPAIIEPAGSAPSSAQPGPTPDQALSTARPREIAAAAASPLGLVVPDSEFVLGPTLYGFDTAEFVAQQAGYLAGYTELVGGEVLTGASIVDRVATEYSIGQRLILALIEMHSGWVSDTDPSERTFAVPEPLPGLAAGLSMAAGRLNGPFYAYRYENLRTITLSDGSAVPIPDANAGSFALLDYLSRAETRDTWAGLGPASRFSNAWTGLFGDPYFYATYEGQQAGLPAAELDLPFAPGEMWFYVNGPHSLAGPTAPRTAIDFAPPPQEASDCVPSTAWVLAAAPGRVARADGADVMVDLDGDGFEGAGWVHVYRHLSAIERIAEGKRVKRGDRLGHPSCEGGASAPARVSVGRRYNGEWIPVDRSDAPLVMGSWAAVPGAAAGAGYLLHEAAPRRTASTTKNAVDNGVIVMPDQR